MIHNQYYRGLIQTPDDEKVDLKKLPVQRKSRCYG